MTEIMGSVWFFPALEVLHVTGIVLWVGAIALVDLRLLGISKSTPVHPYHLLPSAHIGITITIITGIIFVIGNPNYLSNPAFLTKMGLIMAAVVLSAGLHSRMLRDVEVLKDRMKPPTSAKLLGATSLALWFCVIIAGRYIPYVYG